VNDWITDNPTVVPINVSLDTPTQDEYLMSVLYDDTSVAIAIKQALDEFHLRGTNHEKISKCWQK
jgi:hypothetical protein